MRYRAMRKSALVGTDKVVINIGVILIIALRGRLASIRGRRWIKGEMLLCLRTMRSSMRL